MKKAKPKRVIEWRDASPELKAEVLAADLRRYSPGVRLEIFIKRKQKEKEKQ